MFEKSFRLHRIYAIFHSSETRSWQYFRSRKLNTVYIDLWCYISFLGLLFSLLPLLPHCASCSELFELLFSAGLCSAMRHGGMLVMGDVTLPFFVYEHTEVCTDKYRLIFSFFHPGEFTGEEETLDFLSAYSYGTGLHIVFQRHRAFNQLQFHMDKRPKNK